jgi:hypothetical protein
MISHAIPIELDAWAEVVRGRRAPAQTGTGLAGTERPTPGLDGAKRRSLSLHHLITGSEDYRFSGAIELPDAVVDQS